MKWSVNFRDLNFHNSTYTFDIQLAERVWYTKSQSSLLNIYFRFSGIQSLLLLIYFGEGPNSCLSWCRYAPKYGTDPMRYMRLHFTEIAPPKPLLCVNSRTIRY